MARRRDEYFHVLEGHLHFTLGTDSFDVEEGGSVFVPRGTRHGFKPDVGARYLLVIAPAGLDGFLTELGGAWPPAGRAQRSVALAAATTLVPLHLTNH